MLLEAEEGGARELLAVGLALAQHGRQLAGEFARDANLLQNVAKLARELFLANVGVAASAAMAGAVVVDVLALLRLGSEGAPASSARDETGEGVPALRVARTVGGCEDVLHPVEQGARDDRFVQARMQLAEPVKLTVIDRVLEQLVNPGLHERAAAGAIGQACRCCHLRQRFQRIFA
ncbi:MAG: hypothetical protein ABMA15_12030 [Vicinamibacterales bacterium]